MSKRIRVQEKGKSEAIFIKVKKVDNPIKKSKTLPMSKQIDEEEESSEEEEGEETADEEEEEESAEEEVVNEMDNNTYIEDNTYIEEDNSSEDEKAKKKKKTPTKSPSKAGRQTAGARLGKQLVKDVVELLEKGKSQKKISSILASKILIEANQIQAIQALNETEILSTPDINNKSKKRFEMLEVELPKTLTKYLKMTNTEMFDKRVKYAAELTPLLKQVETIQKRMFMMDYLREQQKDNSPQFVLVKDELQKYIEKNESACVELAVDNDSQIID